MVLNAIKNRKSVRKYKEQEVSDDIIQKILEAGRLAPSWVNVQPWKFIVVKKQETKDVLANISGGQKQIKTAPVLICCVADLEDWGKTRFGKVLEQKGLDSQTIDSIVDSKLLNPSNLGKQLTLLRSVEQVTYATAYMTLEVEELGLGCCVVGALSNEMTQTSQEDIVKAKEILGLNSKQVLVNMISIGYDDSSVETKKLRKEPELVIFYENLK